MKQHNKGNAVLILIVLVALFFGYTAIKKSGKVSPKKEDSSVVQDENLQAHEERDIDKEDSALIEENETSDEESGVEDIRDIESVEQVKDIVCCRTGAVVPDPVYKYEFTTRDKCKAPCVNAVDGAGHAFTSCAVGGSYKIVDDSFCEKAEENTHNEQKFDRKPPVHVSSVLPLPEYIYAQGDWPPVVEHLHKKYECHEGNTGGDVPLTTEERVINGKTFCISSTSDAAAGSRYTDYTYTTPVSDGVEEVNFTLRYPSCGAYESPVRERCEYSQSHFNLDSVVASFNW